MLGPVMRHQGAFTLIELMVVVAVVAVLLTLAAPSFYDFILMQRLKGVQAQLVTDLQLARSEAVTRNTMLRLSFRADGEMTCYSLYTSSFNSQRCDCTLGPETRCAGSTREVRTVQTPRSSRVLVAPPSGQPTAFAFDPVTGGLVSIPQDNPSQPLDRVVVGASIDTARAFHTVVNRAGRPTVCAPAGSSIGEDAC